MFRHTSSANLKNTAESCGSFFFTPDTMRFFDSRLLDSSVYVSEDGTQYVFVTSERNDDEPRRYSVRVARIEDGHFRTDYADGTDFQQFETSREALKFARELASK